MSGAYPCPSPLTDRPVPSVDEGLSQCFGFSIQEQLLRSDEKQFQDGLVFKARRLFVSLNSRPRVIKKKKKKSSGLRV